MGAYIISVTMKSTLQITSGFRSMSGSFITEVCTLHINSECDFST